MNSILSLIDNYLHEISELAMALKIQCRKACLMIVSILLSGAMSMIVESYLNPLLENLTSLHNQVLQWQRPCLKEKLWRSTSLPIRMLHANTAVDMLLFSKYKGKNFS